MKVTRRRIFEILQIGKDSDKASRIFDFTLVGLILVNLALDIAFTFDELKRYAAIFSAIETITVLFFTVEFSLRLWTADLLYGKGRIASAVRYVFSFNGVVEFLSIAPFYMPLLFPTGIIAFRMFRVVRILRLFQANAYSDSLSTILIVLKRKRNQILSSMMIILIIMIMSSLVMYGFEHEAQPDVFRNAFSGIWWASATLLTVGYGDIYPVTLMGKIASIVITFLGVGMVAIPTGILSAGFTIHISEQRLEQVARRKGHFCPHCGEKI